ncbi:hypothetical protein KUA19_07715 [Catellatospora sp. NEAU-YM18]|nr:hypothetical protein [Catellatospora tritici]
MAILLGCLLAAACRDEPATPSPHVTFDPFEGMPVVASWSSATSDTDVVLAQIPDNGHGMWLRTRCSGSGRTHVTVRGASFSIDRTVECDGEWHATDGFPALGDPDVGPYPITVDPVDRVNNWEVVVLQSVSLHRPVSGTPSPSTG